MLVKYLKKINFLKTGLSKREKIIAVTLILTLGILFSTRLGNFIYLKERLIIYVGLVSYFLSLWALWEGITKTKAILLLILPTLFTMAVVSVYFLLPVRPPKLIWAAGFGFSFYLLLLSQNVFNVAAIRTIPLYRVATTTSFLFSIFTAFILFNVTYAFNLAFYWNALAVFLIGAVLSLPIFWSIEMENITYPILFQTAIVSLLIGEAAMALSFWPLAPTIWSLSLSTLLYILLATVIDYKRDKLNKRLLWEYIFFGIGIFIVSFLVTSWTG